MGVPTAATDSREEAGILMNSKRSYLENLNTGRQRRPEHTLDEISRTLNQLEDRLGRALDKDNRPEDEEDDIIRRMERLSDRAGLLNRPEMPPAGAPEPSPRANLERIAREIEQSRLQEDQLASIGGIAAELKALREDMRGAVNSGPRGEPQTPRAELERTKSTVPTPSVPGELNVQFERLSRAIEQLAEQSDDKNSKLLRLDIEQVKTALANVARDDTVRAPEGRARGADPAMERLAVRIEEIAAAVNSLPDSLSLHSLEQSVRTLAIALDRFAERSDRNGPDLYAMVEERLDEISRAITASAALAHTPAFDASQFERIEARIASLAGQLDELVQNRPEGLIVERLGALSEQVDEIARRIDTPEHAMDHMNGLAAQISEKLNAAPQERQADRFFRGLEDRFAHFSELVARRAQEALQQERGHFHDLERRLENIAERFDRRTGIHDAESELMAALDDRFAGLAAQLGGSHHAARDESAFHALEARLDDIAQRLQSSASAVPVDSEVIRNLEKQVASLAEHLSQPGREFPPFEDMNPRLEKIERTIEENRAAVLEAARHAAEEVAERLATGHTHAVDDHLRAELEKLQTLTRKSDERNTKTFEAIHDTLIKIVDRLSSLEEGTERRAALPVPSQELPAHLAEKGETPPIDLPESSRTPSEAATAAAEAALRENDDQEANQEPRKLLAGLSRAFSARRNSQGAPREEPVLSTEELEIGAFQANEPLEPGSGVPDIHSIIRRVREQQEARERPAEETGKADFIAAARRAAQAAAEAETEGANQPRKKSRKQEGVLRRRRKQLLLTMAAAVLIAGGVYVGGSFIQKPEDVMLLGKNSASEGETETLTQSAAADLDPVQTRTTPEPAETPSQPDDEETASALPEPPEVTQIDADRSAHEDDTTAGQTSEQTAPALPAELPSNPEATQTPQAEPAPAVAAELPAIPPEIGPSALREAAADGKADALYEIASRFAEGRGVAADMTKAAQWYELAAEKGLAPAQYRIGNLYEKGIGVERNFAEAKTWYQRAAEQGNASAMHNLGVLFAMGADGSPDNTSAARWFQEAADLGVTDSQFNLGILATKGVGIPVDLVEAYKWFDIVARTGDDDAAAKRDEIAKTMAPADLAQAQGKAKLWTARQPKPAANSVTIPAEWQQGQEITAGVDMKKAISNVQLILNNAGFEAGPADGVMGEKTRAAIRAFQRQNGMAETGEIDESLVRALLKQNG
ncbi:peptidoglycan-binding protein [Chelativorans sp. AA-79]|uniref:peptidoglycan-binding protein n=1 Tax=Chelativorans sp. AA-79 TaxID=3028735 RepID=UPI0023F63E7B|nr:peptidoglycan-binding protein [Chelativorans sp. AA-79]WEX09092.1 peptidoglycan-binding protein [Chelativorans sp. AA-79]